MLHQIFPAPLSLSIISPDFNLTGLIFQIITLLICTALLFLLKSRFFKIFFACSIEVMLWFIMKNIFGKEALITQIFTWFTAAAAIILMIAIVNRINWNSLRRGD